MIKGLIAGIAKNHSLANVSLASFASKNQKAFKYISDKPIYDLETCLKLVRAHDNTVFDQTISMTMIMNANPLKGEQMIRGTAILPHGKGKSFKIAVFTDSDYYDMALEGGADVILKESDIKNLTKEAIQFDKLLSTPESLPILKPFGRLLGPMGLMPNLKDQTLVNPENLVSSIQEFKHGKINFRMDKSRHVRFPFAKSSFEDYKVMENLKSVIQAVEARKPDSLKGRLLAAAYMYTTQGPSFRVKIENLELKNVQCQVYDIIENSKKLLGNSNPELNAENAIESNN